MWKAFSYASVQIAIAKMYYNETTKVLLVIAIKRNNREVICEQTFAKNHNFFAIKKPTKPDVQPIEDNKVSLPFLLLLRSSLPSRLLFFGPPT